MDRSFLIGRGRHGAGRRGRGDREPGSHGIVCDWTIRLGRRRRQERFQESRTTGCYCAVAGLVVTCKSPINTAQMGHWLRVSRVVREQYVSYKPAITWSAP